MKLWLDDFRDPMDYGADETWCWVKTVEDARHAILDAELRGEEWTHASLDHDLGACEKCEKHWSRCEHFGTGYTLVCWMEETGHWPTKACYVHSMKPEGRRRMQQVIDKHYGGINGELTGR
jgi:hypothetical protein